MTQFFLQFPTQQAAPNKAKVRCQLRERVQTTTTVIPFATSRDTLQLLTSCNKFFFFMIGELIVCVTIESLRRGSRRFHRHTAGLHQAMVPTENSTLVGVDWCVSILP